MKMENRLSKLPSKNTTIHKHITGITNEKGFTLYEMLVALFITSIVFSASMSMYHFFFKTNHESYMNSNFYLISEEITDVIEKNISYNDEVTIAPNGRTVTIGDIQIDYVTADNKIIIFNNAEVKKIAEYTDIYLSHGKNFAEKIEAGSFTLNFTVIFRNESRAFSKKFDFLEKKYDEVYLII